MATELKLRRGTTAQHSTFTGGVSEVTVDTDKDTVVVHDGATVGGIPLAKETGSAISATTLAYTGTLTGGTGVINIGSGQVVKDANGNVGIGTSTPAAPLDVAGRVFALSNDSSPDAVVKSSVPGVGVSAFGSNAGSGAARKHWKLSVSNEEVGFIGTAGNDFNFGTAGAERLRIDASGNVGIGTSSPASLLHVSDSGEIRGASSSADTLILLGGASGNANRIAIRGASHPTTPNVCTINTNNTERMRIDSSGNLLVGTTSASANVKFEVVTSTSSIAKLSNTGSSPFGINIQYLNAAPNGASNSFLTGQDSEGEEFRITSAGAFVQASDRRVKSNIKNASDALPIVENILVREYDKGFENLNHWTHGFIAQEIHEVYPEVVNKPEKEEDMWGVEYSRLVPLLTKAIQELSAKVDTLQAELNTLKGN